MCVTCVCGVPVCVCGATDLDMGETGEVGEGEKAHLTIPAEDEHVQHNIPTDKTAGTAEGVALRLTVATLNVETLYMEAGGYGHSMRRVRDVMDERGFDIIFLTETNTTKRRMD